MSEQTSKLLLELSKADAKLFAAQTKKNGIDKYCRDQLAELSNRKKTLTEREAALKDSKLRQVLEEHRLRDEEQKITERRKQLSTLGGAKAARLVEREIDIATRSLESMEERVLKAIDEAGQMETQLAALRAELEAAESQFESGTSDREADLTRLSEDITASTQERDRLVAQLEDRIRNLYLRVRGRFPNSAVAVAEKGACKSCFRALPSQLYNQLQAGNTLLQCPGCSRILVYFESSDDSPTS